MSSKQNEIKAILRNYFGHEEFRGNQEEIILNTLEGKDSLVLMPTGGGKSLCYQIPALYLDGLTIVISPWIALMTDQVDALCEKGIEAAYLNSSLSQGQQDQLQEAVFYGHIKILYVSPERFAAPFFQDLLLEIEVSLFAIDEAHCVSQWGHDFRPEYMQVGNIASNFPEVPKIALTATAGEATRKDMVESLHIQDAEVYVSSFDRPNIEYNIQKKSTKENDFNKLQEFIKTEYPENSGIVYCLSRKKTQEVSSFLRKCGLNSYPYHAGLKQSLREEVLEKFTKGDKIIVVATIAFGMGIDKPNVRFVAHMDLPKCMESYYQETGRAGRDGLKSKAWMVYGAQEIVMLKRMMSKGRPGVKRKRVNEQKLDAMLGLAETTVCRREVLLNYFDDFYEGPCHCCDICLSKNIEMIESTAQAIIALKASYETNQKYEITYLVNILIGAEDESIFKRKHNEISSFAAGRDKDSAYWYSIFRQLVSAGMLKVTMDGTTEVRLTENALLVIKGKKEVWLRKAVSKVQVSTVRKKTKKKTRTRKPKSTTTPKRKSTSTNQTSFISAGQQEVYEYLKAFRKELARARKTKPYRIFHDKTLLEMASIRPTELHEMEEIYGVGPKKIKKFGKIFLKALTDMA
jgi:ATP-dependent DNA helicase RecQ